MEADNLKLTDTKYTIAEYKDGIVFVDFVQEIEIDIQIAKEIVSLRKADLQGYKLPFVVFIKNVKSVSDEARDYFAQPEALEYVKSVAVISSTRFHNMIVIFFILFSKPVVPTKMFSDLNKAKEWTKRI